MLISWIVFLHFLLILNKKLSDRSVWNYVFQYLAVKIIFIIKMIIHSNI